MADIYIVRHAQASFGAANYDQLSELGWRQAAILGDYFAARELVFDRVITGEHRRHEETARAVINAGELALDRETHAGFNEFNFPGIYNLYRQRYPDDADVQDCETQGRVDPKPYYRVLRKAMLHWATDHELDESGELESWQQFSARTRAAIDYAGTGVNDEKILVVSSAGAISMVLKHLLDLPLQSMLNFIINMRNTAITHALQRPSGFIVTSINTLSHLDTAEHRDIITFT